MAGIFDRLHIRGTESGHISFHPMSEPARGQAGDAYIDEQGSLRVHNGTTWALAGESAAAGRANRGNTTVFLGDSITKQSSDIGAFDMKDYPNWAHLLSDGRIRLTYNAGIGGQNSQEILDRIESDVIAYSPARCVVLAGTNDFSDAIYTTTTDRLEAIYTTLQANSIEPILATMTPRTDLDATAALSLHATNAWIRQYAASHGLVLFDAYAAVVETDGGWVSGYSDDALHPNEAGAKVLGQACADALSPYYAPVDPLYARLITDPANLLTNGVFTGDTNADGVANNWTASNSGATVTPSIVADTAIPGSWQQIAVTAATSGQYGQIFQNCSTAWSVGDRVSFSGRVVSSDLSANSVISINLSFIGGAAPNVLGISGSPIVVDGAFHLEQIIPAGTTSIRARILITNAPGTIKVAQVAVRNLTTLGVA